MLPMISWMDRRRRRIHKPNRPPTAMLRGKHGRVRGPAIDPASARQIQIPPRILDEANFDIARRRYVAARAGGTAGCSGGGAAMHFHLESRFENRPVLIPARAAFPGLTCALGLFKITLEVKFKYKSPLNNSQLTISTRGILTDR